VSPRLPCVPRPWRSWGIARPRDTTTRQNDVPLPYGAADARAATLGEPLDGRRAANPRRPSGILPAVVTPSPVRSLGTTGRMRPVRSATVAMTAGRMPEQQQCPPVHLVAGVATSGPAADPPLQLRRFRPRAFLGRPGRGDPMSTPSRTLQGAHGPSAFTRDSNARWRPETPAGVGAVGRAPVYGRGARPEAPAIAHTPARGPSHDVSPNRPGSTHPSGGQIVLGPSGSVEAPNWGTREGSASQYIGAYRPLSAESRERPAWLTVPPYPRGGALVVGTPDTPPSGSYSRSGDARRGLGSRRALPCPARPFQPFGGCDLSGSGTCCLWGDAQGTSLGVPLAPLGRGGPHAIRTGRCPTSRTDGGKVHP
jgi:hypothetical protein